jgi:hypothetical protein
MVANYYFLIDILHYFYWPSLFLLVFGIVGNVFLFIIYLRLRKLSVSFYYRISAFIDLFASLNWLKIFLREEYSFFIVNISIFFCKISDFSIFSAFAISSWIQVIISIDRLFHIIYPTKCSILTNLKFQVSVLVIIFAVNLAYFSIHLIEKDLVYTNVNGTNITKASCLFQTHSLDAMLSWLQIGNIVTSFIFMTLASCITIVFIVKSRQRLKTLANGKARKSQVRDIKFAITSISLNLFFLLTNAPNPFYNTIYSVYEFPIDQNLEKFLAIVRSFLLFSYFVFSFYVQLFVNNLVRAEFLKIFGRHSVG